MRGGGGGRGGGEECGRPWSRVACRYPPPPPLPMVSHPPNGENPNIREGRSFVSKVPTVTGMGPPEPGILVSVVTFEATQLRGVFKVATLSWLGHGPAADPQP